MLYRQLFGVPSFRYGSAFNELDMMRRQMDRLMDAFSGESFRVRSAGVFPLVNLTEDRGNRDQDQKTDEQDKPELCLFHSAFFFCCSAIFLQAWAIRSLGRAGKYIASVFERAVLLPLAPREPTCMRRPKHQKCINNLLAASCTLAHVL